MTEPLTDETIREWMYRLDGVEPLVKERFHSLGQALLNLRAEMVVLDRTCADLLANDYRLMQEKDEKLRVALADNAALVEAVTPIWVSLRDWKELAVAYLNFGRATADVHKLGIALQAPHPGAALLERIAKLEAVVEAARPISRLWPDHAQDDAKVEALQKALAALDAEAQS